MSAMKMHYSSATPPSFPMARNLFFGNLADEAALTWPPGGEGSHKGSGGGHTGGVGGASPPTSQHQAPTHELVHWMSVMAGHMNNPHNDAAVHYMWNGVE
ncbi:unnamed protein product, partial [Meganyctiphanes norvegica]